MGAGIMPGHDCLGCSREARFWRVWARFPCERTRSLRRSRITSFSHFSPRCSFSLESRRVQSAGAPACSTSSSIWPILLPPGSQQIVSEFLVNRGPDAWKWALVGLVGTLIAGTQVMRLLMEGIHSIYGDHDRPGYWHRQLRSVLLLLITIAPLIRLPLWACLDGLCDDGSPTNWGRIRRSKRCGESFFTGRRFFWRCSG